MVLSALITIVVTRSSSSDLKMCCLNPAVDSLLNMSLHITFDAICATLAAGSSCGLDPFAIFNSRLDQRWRRLFEEVNNAAEILRVRIPHFELVWAHRSRLFAVISHHPPVAARGKGSCIVFDRHGRCGKHAGWDDRPVVLVFVDVAVFVGDADTANRVRGIILDFDEGGAFGEAEGEGEETESKKELGDS
jgi:hypothetical protein